MTKTFWARLLFERQKPGVDLYELGKASMTISETFGEANAEPLDQGGIGGGFSAFMWF